MQIQINTGSSIEGREALSAHIRTVVENALGHLASHVTRVEVHVADENGAKTVGDDKRCVMEARLEGRPPAAVTHQAGAVHDAATGAADKLARLIEHTLGRLEDERAIGPIPSAPFAHRERPSAPLAGLGRGMEAR